MSSVLQKIKRKKSNAHGFQITASVTALTLECRKDVWHPNKLKIFWDNTNTNCHTKPVQWQPGVNNPFRGIHVWPEPDPVTTTSTFYKENIRKGTYQDHLWKIVIKNETKSGKRRIIATACIDLADYISEIEKTFDITVTLKPANKNILSGSLEFTFTSVLLEDGIPYRPKEELIREILGGALKYASHGSKETTEKLKAVKETNNIPLEDLNKTVLALPCSAGEKTDLTQEQSDAKELSVQAGDTKNDGSGATKKVRRKAPPPSTPRPPTRHKASATVAPAVEKKNDVKEVKSSSAQGNREEKASKRSDKTLSSGHKGRKTKSKNSYPKELNPFETSSDEARSLSPVMTSSPREMVAQTCERGKMGKDDGEEKASCTGVPSSPGRRKKRHGTKKANKYPKELNPFGGSSDEEADTPPAKETEMKKRSKSSVSDEHQGGKKSSKKSSFSDEAVVLKEAKPFRPENTGETFARDKAFGGKAEDVVRCEVVDTSTSHADDAKEENQRPLSSEAVFTLYKSIPDHEESPVSGDADHCIAAASGGTGRDQHDATTTGTHEKVYGTAAAAEMQKAKDTDSAAKEKKKQRLAHFCNKLLHPVPQKDLSVYVAEETNLLTEEIAALDRVSIKLELEIRQTMDIKDCKEDVDGLMQDWLILNDYRTELISRKQNLQILDKQEDIDICCNILRSEIKLLFELEDWRKTARQRAQEARLFDLLLSFVEKRRENYLTELSVILFRTCTEKIACKYLNICK